MEKKRKYGVLILIIIISVIFIYFIVHLGGILSKTENRYDISIEKSEKTIPVYTEKIKAIALKYNYGNVKIDYGSKEPYEEENDFYNILTIKKDNNKYPVIIVSLGSFNGIEDINVQYVNVGLKQNFEEIPIKFLVEIINVASYESVSEKMVSDLLKSPSDKDYDFVMGKSSKPTIRKEKDIDFWGRSKFIYTFHDDRQDFWFYGLTKEYQKVLNSD